MAESKSAALPLGYAPSLQEAAAGYGAAGRLSMLDIKDLPTRISLGVIAVPLCSRTLRACACGAELIEAGRETSQGWKEIISRA